MLNADAGLTADPRLASDAGVSASCCHTVVELLQQLTLWAVPVLAAVILHEIAHGYVAFRLGDPTAARAGRLTLNPIPHIDPIGTRGVCRRC